MPDLKEIIIKTIEQAENNMEKTSSKLFNNDFYNKLLEMIKQSKENLVKDND